MRLIFDAIKDLMKLETEYIFCNLSVLATEGEFSQFISKTSLREGSICVFNLGDNSLFEGLWPQLLILTGILILTGALNRAHAVWKDTSPFFHFSIQLCMV